MAKKYRTSNKPILAESRLGHWTPYHRGTESNPNLKNSGRGRVNKRRVLQLRYLQSKDIKPI